MIARGIGFTFAIILTLVASTSAHPGQVVSAQSDVQIPSQSDWTEQGLQLLPGPAGSWDVRLSGSLTPTTVVKLNGVYYLYYIGADGNRSTDGGPRHRALGVATSTDGINFTKYSGNPVITHLPHNNEEEGVFSAGAMVVGGQVVLYYGAMDAGSSRSTSVDSDIRLAVSSDGFNFTEVGDVVSHADDSVWNSGDELFPVGVHQDSTTTYVYYIAKGKVGSWKLGVASGPAIDNLPNTGPVLTDGSKIKGGTDPILVTPDTLAYFIVREINSPRTIEVWTAPASDPGQLSGPLETYKFGDVNNATVLLDQDTGTWFMYYMRSAKDGIAVRTASAVGGDTIPPSQVTGLSATAASESQLNLSWAAASDSESGVSSYNIYRDGVQVGSSATISFSDTGLTEGATYSYQVSAVNGMWLEGAKSDPITGSTLADTTPPSIISVTASSDLTRVRVVYSEAMDQPSATDTGNYAIDQGITISSASLGADLKTVTLVTTSHTDGMTYALTVNNVTDRATTPNVIALNTQAGYTFVSQLTISNLSVASGEPYNTVTGLASGDTVYIDRKLAYTSVPSDLQGAAYIQTASGDEQASQEDFLSFSVNLDAKVYVAYDVRGTPDQGGTLPDWLSTWTDTGFVAGTTYADLRLYAKNFSAGSITLGGNLAVGASGADRNYTVIFGAVIPPSQPTQWNGDVTFIFTLQGRGNSGPSWTMPFEVSLYTPSSAGQSNLVSSFTLTTDPTTVDVGTFVLNVTPGTYDIWAKGENTLAVLLRDVDLNTKPAFSISLGPELGGDSSKDNVIDGLDYSAILELLGIPTSSLAAGERLNDHNRDGIVDIVDYLIVVENFGRSGVAQP